MKRFYVSLRYSLPQDAVEDTGVEKGSDTLLKGAIKHGSPAATSSSGIP